ncbi:unnamed protein product [Eruca vesicaria subsp. sativa]|uniref:WRKY domain-containing protein n=1 Tax=Eruca vesicaria subsp. sativa TaxID=29727 RepID=A0ABC8LR24_ERUVS|nr:unnamed protein product [Eruca vesicaria subsp. sativa]
MNSPHEKAMQAILYGHNCAKRLKQRLEDPMADDSSVSDYDLATSIVHCFSNAISILSDSPKSEDDQVSDLSSMGSPPPLPERSYSKKRKINMTNSIMNWRDDSPDPYYDGFLWRKYGQKSIKNTKHERSYYRCSYNIDHACEARKHEQQIKDNPPVYRTTYFGHHTCKINHNHDAVFTAVRDQVDDMGSSRIIRFGKELDQEKENHSTGFPLPVKHEEGIIKEETTDQYREMTGDDVKDCQHVMEENQSSLSSSYTPPSSSVSETDVSDLDLLLNNLDSWDRYGLFDFGVQ